MECSCEPTVVVSTATARRCAPTQTKTKSMRNRLTLRTSLPIFNGAHDVALLPVNRLERVPVRFHWSRRVLEGRLRHAGKEGKSKRTQKKERTLETLHKSLWTRLRCLPMASAQSSRTDKCCMPRPGRHCGTDGRPGDAKSAASGTRPTLIGTLARPARCALSEPRRQ